MQRQALSEVAWVSLLARGYPMVIVREWTEVQTQSAFHFTNITKRWLLHKHGGVIPPDFLLGLVTMDSVSIYV